MNFADRLRGPFLLRLFRSGVRASSLALLLVLAVSPAISRSEAGSAPEAELVLVELFTSEGCSSCPPADRLLRELAEHQPVPHVEVLALSFHVDYWNHLGWEDPFSSPRWSARQREYARRLGESTVFTPQAVVDGAHSLVGSDREGVLTAIESASKRPHDRLELTAAESEDSPRTWILRVRGAPAASTASKRLHVAIVEDGLSSSVSRGENAGRELSHASVVRQLYGERLAAVDGGELTLEVTAEPGWRREKLRAVVWVQSARGSIEALGRTVLDGARSP